MLNNSIFINQINQLDDGIIIVFAVNPNMVIRETMFTLGVAIP